jgi:DMSO/TMAO reductase YedYZ heme-binding membrane subunit
MKAGLLTALAIAVAWALLAIAQIWLQPVSAQVFFKLSVTAGILTAIVLVVTLAVREYFSEKKMKDDGFIDG